MLISDRVYIKVNIPQIYLCSTKDKIKPMLYDWYVIFPFISLPKCSHVFLKSSFSINVHAKLDLALLSIC